MVCVPERLILSESFDGFLELRRLIHLLLESVCGVWEV